MLLVDTNVVSELRRAQTGRGDPNVAAWGLRTPESSLFLSVISLRELETWVLGKERKDPAQGRAMRKWIDEQIRPSFASRLLPVTEAVALCCARLFVPNQPPTADAFIAATALVHGLTVVTRDVGDFAAMGVRTFNPWEPAD
jgi:predicted nucleic acid-binding protein